MLTVENIQARYGDATALHGISLDVTDGQVTGILGSNGAGKSTLLKVIAGHLKPAGGTVFLDGEPITGLPPYAIAELGIALVPEGRRVFANLTVEDNLLVGGSSKRAKPKRAEALRDVFELFPRLSERRAQSGGTLSGGEQQMLAIGRALMLRPRIILLDEPSLGLAPLITDLVFETIRTIAETGVTMLLVEQNASLALSTADYGYVLEHGRVVFSGDRATLRTSPEVQEAYLGVEAHATEGGRA
ncbi:MULTISPECIES: ABC transporter ATP-binding protein [unclassified Cryobacterium]|uniref:ABC transporter ATP-binding protein n=1 Tax=unclassified Cryobacterium TaxID=2649013 RepID=UPI00106956CF|nr:MULTISPECIES: ABC transporter ATP-binding protein [unclassified Cryobacterium]TFD02970.1 ABC transporter ATP-binding protein [Cryobacterium sp. TMT1-66-1]TFD15345.1 ABC transporter ATP-binding protein [Cryobacterium sp. TMT1-2-2]